MDMWMDMWEVLRYTNAPVCCADAAMGMIIRVSGQREQAGVQVPGEEDIRWVRQIDLVDLGGGAIVELQPVEAGA